MRSRVRCRVGGRSGARPVRLVASPLRRGRATGVEPGHDRGVVGRGVGEGGAGQPAPGRVGERAAGAELLEHRGVVGWRRTTPTWAWFLAAARTMAVRRCRSARPRGPSRTGTGCTPPGRSARSPALQVGRCSGTERSARIPPWIAGWRVLTRPPSISGAPVTSLTSRWAILASLSAADGVAAGHQLPAEVDRPRASSIRPSLS